MLSKLSPLPHTQPNHLVNFDKIFNLVTRGPIRLRFSQILHFVVNNTKYVHAWVCTNISLRCSLFVIVFDFPRYSSLRPAELLHQSKICVCVCVWVQLFYTPAGALFRDVIWFLPSEIGLLRVRSFRARTSDAI